MCFDAWNSLFLEFIILLKPILIIRTLGKRFFLMYVVNVVTVFKIFLVRNKCKNKNYK